MCDIIYNMKTIIKVKNYFKDFWKEHSDFFVPILSVCLLYGFYQLMNITCPIKYVLGISCPGCGMTRAFLSLLRLDFGAAFYFHPMWPLIIVMAVLYLLFWRKRRLMDLIFVCFSIILLITYLVRLCFTETDIVVFNISEGLIYKIITNIIK